MKTMLFACLGVLLAACSSGASQGSFVVADAVATEQPEVGAMQITLASIGGVCGLMQTAKPAPVRDYDVVTFRFGAIQPGTYTLTSGEGVPSAGHAEALYLGNRACTSDYGSFATGTVIITSVDNGHVAGTYDLHFAHGWPYGKDFAGEAQGSFDAPVCDTQGNVPAITCQ